MYGIGNNHQFFIIAFQLLESILTKIAGVSFFSMNEQHGTADFIGIRKDRCVEKCKIGGFVPAQTGVDGTRMITSFGLVIIIIILHELRRITGRFRVRHGAGISVGTVASTMYDISRCTANGYFDAADNADARYKMRQEFNAQRTEDYRTDIHAAEEATMAAEYVDILQIPAFLCRQTDLLVAAAKTGKTINIKKGQFLSPLAMRFAADKVVEAGNRNVMLTERGTTFGYQDLVIDYRGIPEMQTFGFPVILDVTHSLQQPNQTSGITGGMPQLIETVAKAGVAVGVDGLFIETHENPAVAKSDGANMLKLDLLEDLLTKLVRIREAVR